MTAAIANSLWNPVSNSAVATCLSCTGWGVYNLVVSGMSVQIMEYPTGQPSSQPSRTPSIQPTRQPTYQPSRQPSSQPTSQPASTPTSQPTSQPTQQPTRQPTTQPSTQPSAQPTTQPTSQPSRQPTSQPSRMPSGQPSKQPSSSPTSASVPTDAGNMVTVSFAIKNILNGVDPTFNGFMNIDSQGNPVFVSYAMHFIARVNSITGTITAIAGSLAAGSTGSFSGDGGPATSARLNGPLDTAFDTAGNFYIADSLNNIIRLVSVSGYIRTFAGTGSATKTGDGSLASISSVYDPVAVRIDGGGGFLYFTERNNCKIRKINLKTGTIFSTFLTYILSHFQSFL